MKSKQYTEDENVETVGSSIGQTLIISKSAAKTLGKTGKSDYAPIGAPIIS